MKNCNSANLAHAKNENINKIYLIIIFIIFLSKNKLIIS